MADVPRRGGEDLEALKRGQETLPMRKDRLPTRARHAGPTSSLRHASLSYLRCGTRDQHRVMKRIEADLQCTS